MVYIAIAQAATFLLLLALWREARRVTRVLSTSDLSLATTEEFIGWRSTVIKMMWVVVGLIILMCVPYFIV